MPKILAPPPALFLITLILSSVAHSYRPILLGVPTFAIGMTAGIVVLVVAALLGASALRAMHRAKTTIDPYGSPTALVTSGPFRFTRNPLYVALVLVHAALAIMADSVWLAAGSVVLVLLLDFGVIGPEERHVEKIFGSDYLEYKKRVRRWI